MNLEDKGFLNKYLEMNGYNQDKIDIKNFAQNFGKSQFYNTYDNNQNNLGSIKFSLVKSEVFNSIGSTPYRPSKSFLAYFV